jgi:serine/threonine-protein kinase RsbW
MAKHFSRRMAPSSGDIGPLIDEVDAFLSARDIPRRCAQLFALAFDEVLTNVVAYGGTSDSERFIEVNVMVEGSRVRAEVVDDGIAFNPLLAPDPDITLGVEEREIGGLGIFLVRELMDNVADERRAEFNRLTFSKDCNAYGNAS